MSGEVDDLFTHLVVLYDEKTPVSAAEGIINIKGLQETVIFSLKVTGVNVITCT